MAKKKLTTEDILAQARAQAGGGSPAPENESADTSNEEASAGESTEAGAAEKPAAAPSGTSDILAAARAQAKGGGAEKPAAGGAAPGGTSDILAAARAQAAGGASKPAAGGAPKSTADILAAARGQAGGAKPAAGAAKPASKPTKTAGKAAPVGDRPSVQDMIKAARGEAVPAASEAESAPAKPITAVIPTKPVLVAKSSDKPIPRRGALAAIAMFFAAIFLNAFTLAWVTFAGASVAFVLGVARFMMPNVLVEPPTKFKIGLPDDYPLDMVSTKWKAAFGVWIVHVNYKGKNLVYALSTVCTHLGCTPNWLEGEQKFKCPCHGSGFYINGVNFEGPAPRPLERYGIRLAEDGMLEVDKSVKYQEEMGQWDDPGSFVEMV